MHAGSDVVVVLSYHGRDDTLACVESLVAGSPQAHVLVIDNGSYDGVLEAVRERWPQVDTLQSPRNLGFTGGMNLGLAWALEHGAGTITVLNNDTLVPDGFVRAMAGAARGGALVSPVVMYADEPDRLWFGGGTIDRGTGLARHLTEAEVHHLPDAGETRDTEVLSGCCLTARADVWRALSGFDERFFLMFEDSELSVRARALGIPCRVVSSVRIQHRVSASFTGALSYLGLYYYARNGLLFGSLLPGASARRSLRFLRRHVLPHATGPLRRRTWALAVRRLAAISWAVFSHARRRYGEAPRRLRDLAQHWASDPT